MADVILDQKACPLLLHTGIGGVLSCVGNKCGWWLGEYRDCTLPLIAMSMITLTDMLSKKGV